MVFSHDCEESIYNGYIYTIWAILNDRWSAKAAMQGCRQAPQTAAQVNQCIAIRLIRRNLTQAVAILEVMAVLFIKSGSTVGKFALQLKHYNWLYTMTKLLQSLLLFLRANNLTPTPMPENQLRDAISIWCTSSKLGPYYRRGKY